MDYGTHDQVANWLYARGVKAACYGTGGNNEIVIVDAPSVPTILAFTPGGDESWQGFEYPRRADGDAYMAFWDDDGEELAHDGWPDEDASPEVVGRWILAVIANYPS